MIGPLVLKLALTLCVDGTTASCTLAGCTAASKECVSGAWGPCTCDVTCVEGSAGACALAGCAAAQTTCSGGTMTACQCVIQSCDDANPCTDGNSETVVRSNE